ncbi:MAG: hypothetical protein HKN20_03265 [Gemmatimonadetes bacterium]|nr:hypothetical protein [Gemmatimonadota bacterium]
MRERVEYMRLGDFRDPGLEERFARFPDRVEETAIFHRKRAKYSSYGKCGDCVYRSRCSICPVSIGNEPGNEDPQRVPDFGCAFYLSSLRHADLFHAASRPYRPLGEPPAISPGMKRIRKLANSVRAHPA